MLIRDHNRNIFTAQEPTRLPALLMLLFACIILFVTQHL